MDAGKSAGRARDDPVLDAAVPLTSMLLVVGVPVAELCRPDAAPSAGRSCGASVSSAAAEREASAAAPEWCSQQAAQLGQQEVPEFSVQQRAAQLEQAALALLAAMSGRRPPAAQAVAARAPYTPGPGDEVAEQSLAESGAVSAEQSAWLRPAVLLELPWAQLAQLSREAPRASASEGEPPVAVVQALPQAVY